jgi:hypothetical protein
MKLRLKNEKNAVCRLPEIEEILIISLLKVKILSLQRKY